ncbi:MAG: MinD/ParA family protein [Chloroflexota bacterium]
MKKIITVHSFRQSVGKSTLAANLAAVLAQKGFRVCLLDTDFQGASAHLFFNLSDKQGLDTFNDFVLGKKRIEETVNDVTEQAGEVKEGGKLFLIPSSTQIKDVMEMLHNTINIEQYNKGLGTLAENIMLDYVIVDTRAGLNENSLTVIAVSSVLLLVLHPDQQDFQGTAVTVDVARKLSVPAIRLVLNDSSETLNNNEISKQIELTYQCGRGTVIEHNEDLLALGSSKLFVTTYPDQSYSKHVQELAKILIS